VAGNVAQTRLPTPAEALWCWTISATDRVTFPATPALILAITLAANHSPAGRASRVDPVLRCEQALPRGSPPGVDRAGDTSPSPRPRRRRRPVVSRLQGTRSSMHLVHVALALGVYPTLALVAFAGALFPPISVELAVVGLAAALPSPDILLLAAVATGGQMAGNSAMYSIGRRGVGLTGKYAKALERWGHRLRGSRRSVRAVVFFSSVSGLPPFSVISTLAGTFRTSFTSFVLVGSTGRFLHFGAIILLPLLLRSLAGR
jgi:membrane protein YqaA with SNARE-associated domain